MTESLGRNGVFLESCSGDYFGYNREAKQWEPMGNIGMHHTQTLQTYGSEGDLYLTKTKNFKSLGALAVNKHGLTLFKSKFTEQKCRIDKHYASHFAVLGMPN